MVIEQPIIHDRHIVKEQFQKIKANGELKFKKPDNLTIATCRNSGTLEDRIIPHLSGYEQTSILEENTFKFEMLHNYLNECTTEYFMCLDAIDVIWIGDPQQVMNIFDSFDCEALFMSTHSTDGYECMPKVKEWVDTINLSGRYLNSGVYIGKTSFVKEMIEEAMKYAIPHGVTMDDYRDYLSSKPSDYPKGSQDQDIFRYIEKKFYPRMKVDYSNKMAFRS
jgi:hypothetical protein